MLLSLGRGAIAGLIGGLVFWPQIVAVDGSALDRALAGGTSPALGLAVHLTISIAIGAGYGMLFERESPDWGAAIGWGMLYGITWWFVGTLLCSPSGSELPSPGPPPRPPTRSLHSSGISSTAGSRPPFSCSSNVVIKTGCGSTRALPRARRAFNALLAHRPLRSGFSRSASACSCRFY